MRNINFDDEAEDFPDGPTEEESVGTESYACSSLAALVYYPFLQRTKLQVAECVLAVAVLQATISAISILNLLINASRREAQREQQQQQEVAEPKPQNSDQKAAQGGSKPAPPKPARITRSQTLDDAH